VVDSRGTRAPTSELLPDIFSTPESGDELTMVHRFAIVPLDEVGCALDDAGFDPVEFYTDWAATAPGGPEGPRIIAVGHRPG
jgi:hypothetical protein